MRLITLTTIAVLVSASAAMAQATQFYGPSGGNQGSAVTQPRPFGGTGGNTQFYGSSGEYQGSAVTQPRPFGNFGR